MNELALIRAAMLDAIARFDRLAPCLRSKEEQLEQLLKILNTPMIEPFAAAVVAEAKHQVYRWGEEHDAAKTAWDWYWTLGHLSQKAAHAALIGDLDKALHHTISSAALLANWHRHLLAIKQRAVPPS